MEKEIAMSQNMRPMWTHEKIPADYHKFFSSEIPSGTGDEPIVANFFNNYLPGIKKTIVDMGIGSGRELAWIDKIGDLSDIIGIDYSKPMLSFCGKQKRILKHELILIEDDLLKLESTAKIVRRFDEPLVYVSLINSFGNFAKDERITFLKGLRSLVRSDDRIILCVYKRPTAAMSKNLPVFFPEAAVPKAKIDAKRLCFIREYALIPYVWHEAIEEGGFPCFWYDKKDNDIIIHVDGKRMVISHRFYKEEIIDLAKVSGLLIDKIITGKFMYVAILKTK